MEARKFVVGDVYLCLPEFPGHTLINMSRPLLGLVQLSIQGVPGALSPGVKRQKREADGTLPFSAEVKKVGAILPFPHMSLWYNAELIKNRDNFAFTSYAYYQIIFLLST
jgi:hypothetical protein